MINLPQHDIGSAFTNKQKASLIYTVRQIIDFTKRSILTEEELSDDEIIKMIEEDLFLIFVVIFSILKLLETI